MSDSPSQQISGLVLDSANDFKVAQAVYNTVTGKTEKLSRAFTKNYTVDLGALVQLHDKCQQMIAQWSDQILGQNNSVTVIHLHDNKQQFSSFERFKLYDCTKTAPVEALFYESNFLLKGPQGKGHPYKFTVRIVSRVAAYKGMRDGNAPSFVMRMVEIPAIMVEIEYVDYIIARNIMTSIESWVDHVESAVTPKTIDFLQRYSEWFAPSLSGIMLLISGCVMAKVSREWITASANHADLAHFMIFAFVVIMASTRIARILGKILESQVDSILAISYVKLNKGDDRLVQNEGCTQFWTVIKACTAIALLLIEGVAVTFIADALKPFIFEK